MCSAASVRLFEKLWAVDPQVRNVGDILNTLGPDFGKALKIRTHLSHLWGST